MVCSSFKNVLCLSLLMTHSLMSMPLPQDPSDVARSVSQKPIPTLTVTEKDQLIGGLKTQLMTSLATWVEANKASQFFEPQQCAEFFVYFALLFRASTETEAQVRDNNLLHHDFMHLIEPVGPQIKKEAQNWPSLDLKKAARGIFEKLGDCTALFFLIDKDFHNIHKDHITKENYLKQLSLTVQETPQGSLRKCRENYVKKLNGNPFALYASYFTDCLKEYQLFCHQHNNSFFISIEFNGWKNKPCALYFSLGTEVLPLENGAVSQKNCLYILHNTNDSSTIGAFIKDSNSKIGFSLISVTISGQGLCPALKSFESIESQALTYFVIPENFSEAQKQVIAEDEYFQTICWLLAEEYARLQGLEQEMQQILANRAAVEQKKLRNKEKNAKRKLKLRQEKAAERAIKTPEKAEEIRRDESEDENEVAEEPNTHSSATTPKKNWPPLMQQPSRALNDETLKAQKDAQKAQERFQKLNKKSVQSPSQHIKMLNFLRRFTDLQVKEPGKTTGAHRGALMDGQFLTLVPPHKETRHHPLSLHKTCGKK